MGIRICLTGQMNIIELSRINEIKEEAIRNFDPQVSPTLYEAVSYPAEPNLPRQVNVQPVLCLWRI